MRTRVGENTAAYSFIRQTSLLQTVSGLKTFTTTDMFHFFKGHTVLDLGLLRF